MGGGRETVEGSVRRNQLVRLSPPTTTLVHPNCTAATVMTTAHDHARQFALDDDDDATHELSLDEDASSASLLAHPVPVSLYPDLKIPTRDDVLSYTGRPKGQGRGDWKTVVLGLSALLFTAWGVSQVVSARTRFGTKGPRVQVILMISDGFGTSPRPPIRGPLTPLCRSIIRDARSQLLAIPALLSLPRLGLRLRCPPPSQHPPPHTPRRDPRRVLPHALVQLSRHRQRSRGYCVQLCDEDVQWSDRSRARQDSLWDCFGGCEATGIQYGARYDQCECCCRYS